MLCKLYVFIVFSSNVILAYKKYILFSCKQKNTKKHLWTLYEKYTQLKVACAHQSVIYRIYSNKRRKNMTTHWQLVHYIYIIYLLYYYNIEVYNMTYWTKFNIILYVYSTLRHCKFSMQLIILILLIIYHYYTTPIIREMTP